MTEPCEINIKISVDKTELDALEAQLARIKGLSANGNESIKFHINTGITGELEPCFYVDHGQAFINDIELRHAEINRLDAALNKVNVTGRGKPELETTTEQKLAELEAKINSLSACQSSLTHQFNGL